MKRKRILFTGGGTAGHVTANTVLLPKFAAKGCELHYVGSEHGIERKMISQYEDVTYHCISTGKLRRYMSWSNLTDMFNVLKGIIQAYFIVGKVKPDILFSKGGFVSVPVVIGARLRRVPIVIFEPDVNLGLANRISYALCTKMCTTFEETATQYPSNKTVHVGAIVKEELQHVSAERGRAACAFTKDKPILLVVGGSQGAQRINDIVRSTLPYVLLHFQVVHICGAGKLDAMINHDDYKQFEFVGQLYPDLVAMADVVVSRAGSNTIHELLALRKPMLLIPHTVGGTKTGQLINAQYFCNKGYATMLRQEEMTEEQFVRVVLDVYEQREYYIEAMKKSVTNQAVDKVITLIDDVLQQ
ncbi:undecaprenyldiphospho-muramoylpentapeptide beta-N-acetylglucosaminyltransferase [Paenibacillus arenosi]|uniref:UDP-N-acetylglucosamine--N-acetylmuramyl-(pentapeptide) pyrophosphoryl-undecaprenol N-acetylglucosamine transferase n=1 Tax=Paenibacillus arenosi TaxID=2774142 RepID=A0ABR9B074_9BACL|nr:undecaprenyldiphospho-muramoylpentapeptide beta-N-acetylglucosaminyltransferase [Paenibacillus arenosi]MBD8499343.1 undecaprenyldiphospho-muramoylpentapeptide beta-N-acetylglucosaminyltransferase [Paenibacillus arenosi]